MKDHIFYFLIFLFIVLSFYIFYIEHKRPFYKHKSNIQGHGLFAKHTIHKDTYLFDVGTLYDNKKGIHVSQIGKFINHCNHPNTYLTVEGDICRIYALQTIEKDEELVIDYDTQKFKIPVLGSCDRLKTNTSKCDWTCQKKNYPKK